MVEPAASGGRDVGTGEGKEVRLGGRYRFDLSSPLPRLGSERPLR